MLAVAIAAVATLPASAGAQTTANRDVEPVILTGAKVPTWSGPAASAICMPGLPNGRNAHNGTFVTPPAIGIPVNHCHVCRVRSDPGPCDVDCKLGETQGAYASHGTHYFVTNDTDNVAAPFTLTEIDAQQWQFAVPTPQPTNVGDAHANVVKVPLQTTATPFGL